MQFGQILTFLSSHKYIQLIKCVLFSEVFNYFSVAAPYLVFIYGHPDDPDPNPDLWIRTISIR